jgi:hypothetical protein
VGDGQPVPADGDAERGVAAGVDQPDPYPRAGRAGELGGVGGGFAVDQVVRVVHVAGVAAE